MSPGPSNTSHHRADTTPAPSLWVRATGPDLGNTSGTRLAAAAVDLRRVLDDALERTEPPPCAASPEAWFPTTHEGVEAATDACMDCRVFVICGNYADALEGPRLQGVWAGRLRGLARFQITNNEEQES